MLEKITIRLGSHVYDTEVEFKTKDEQLMMYFDYELIVVG